MILTTFLLAKVPFELQGKDKGGVRATKTPVILDTCDPFCVSSPVSVRDKHVNVSQLP